MKLSQKFDYCTYISTLEHIGIGFYGETKEESGDKETVISIYKFLKSGGKFLLSVPFGVKVQTDSYRSYDWNTLVNILKPFKIETSVFFKEKDGKWVPTDLKTAERVDKSEKVSAIVFI